MTKVLIFDPQIGGHHLDYVRRIFDALYTDFHVIISTNNRLKDTTEFSMYFSDRINNLTYDLFPPLDTSGFMFFFRSYFQLIKAIHKNKPDVVFLPYADGISYIIGLFNCFYFMPKKIRYFGIMMRNDFAYQSRIHFTTKLKLFLLEKSPFNCLFWLDSEAVLWFASNRKKLALVSKVLYEPCNTQSPISRKEACSLFGVNMDRRYIGIAGVIDPRKGINLLLDSIKSSFLPDDVCLFLAGRFDPQVLDLVYSQYKELLDCGKIHVINKVLSETELTGALCLMDVVCATYVNHAGSSGIVSLAMQMRKFIVGPDLGWLGRNLKIYDRSVVYHTIDTIIPSIIEALHKSSLNCLSPSSSNLISPPPCFEAIIRAEVFENKGF